MVVPLALSAPTAATLAFPVPREPNAKQYANCTALNRVYPHGVGKPHAHDHTSGTPVTNFYRSKPLYNANSDKDRDGDGIACEKR